MCKRPALKTQTAMYKNIPDIVMGIIAYFSPSFTARHHSQFEVFALGDARSTSKCVELMRSRRFAMVDPTRESSTFARIFSPRENMGGYCRL